MSCFKSGKSGRNFCPNPVNPVPAGIENSKSGAPLIYEVNNTNKAYSMRITNTYFMDVDQNALLTY